MSAPLSPCYAHRSSFPEETLPQTKIQSRVTGKTGPIWVRDRRGARRHTEAHSFNPSSWEVGAKEQGHPQVRNEFKASLDPVSKTIKQTNKQDTEGKGEKPWWKGTFQNSLEPRTLQEGDHSGPSRSPDPRACTVAVSLPPQPVERLMEPLIR